MCTKLFKINDNNINLNKSEINYCANVLKSGGLVAFPTETVYGLGANALLESAVTKIFVSKGRPQDNPLIIHFGEISQLNNYAYLNENALLLAKHFWPGPLTLVLKKKPSVPYLVTAGLDTVAVRIPSNKIANYLLRQCNFPVAAPSANISGKPSGTRVEHVLDDLNGKVDVILDGGRSEYGLESTVVDLSCDVPVILRPGYITENDLKKFIPEVKYSTSLGQKGDVLGPKSPGMKYKHYSPNAKMVILTGNCIKISSKIATLILEYAEKKLKIGVLTTDENVDKYKNACVISLGNKNNCEQLASNLFDALREFDKLNVDIILAESLPSGGMGFSVMNRLKKAAGFNILDVV